MNILEEFSWRHWSGDCLFPNRRNSHVHYRSQQRTERRGRVDFKKITPAQALEASQELEQAGVLSSDEADTLTGLASPSSYSPVNGWNAETLADFNTNVMNTPVDYLSVLENLTETNATLGLTGEGAQQASVDASLYQRLNSYEAQNQSATAGSGLNVTA